MNETLAPATAPAAIAEAPIAPVQAVIGTFTAPSETFRRLVAKPTWWLPLVLWVVIGTSAGAVFSMKVDWEQAAQKSLEQRAARTGGALPAGAAERFSGVMKMMALVGSPIYVLIAAFLGALVLWGGVRIFGGEAGYVQMLALWLHAYLPKILAGILGIVIFGTMAQGSIDLQNAARLVKSSAAAFLSETAAPWLVALASNFELFTFATIALLVIAFRRIPSLPKAAAIAIPVVLWLIVALIGTGLVAMRG